MDNLAHARRLYAPSRPSLSMPITAQHDNEKALRRAVVVKDTQPDTETAQDQNA